MNDYFSLAFNNLRRRKLRAWLTMIGIFIGIAAVVALISLGQGLQDVIQEEFKKVGSDKIIVQEKGVMGPPGSGTTKSTKLTTDDLEVIRKINGVANAAGILMKTAKIEHGNEIKFNFVIGISSDYEEREAIGSAFGIENGRDLKEGDSGRVVAGIRYSEGKVFKKEIEIGDKIAIEGKDFKIIGELERIGNPYDDSAIIMNKDEMKELFEIDNEESIIYVKVENVAEIEKVKADIEKALRRFRDEKEGQETFQVTTSEQLLQSFSSIFGVVQAVLVGIAAISLLVGGIGIMNTMYTAVLERTREIGTMKAVGARNSDILIIFLFESGLLGLVGGLIGIAIGIGIGKFAVYIASVYLGTNLLRASTSIELIAGALLFSFLIGTISGVLPALQASRLKPVDALRYE